MRERIFNSENKFFTFMGRVADLIILNVIFILFCLPVFTIGASVTAMYYVTLKMLRNEESYIFRTFFKSFKENFKQSTIIWVILLIFGGLLYLDFSSMGQLVSGKTGQLFYIGLYVLLLMYAMITAYVFPILSRFDNTVSNTFLNALKMAVAHFPYTIVLLAVTYVPMFLTLNYGIVLYYSAFVWLAIGFALTAYVTSLLYARIFARYIPAEEEEKEWMLKEE